MAILLFSWWLRVHQIDRSLPYPQHVDETYLADNAANMLRTGDFNPHFFMYGGLPIYLTAAAMTAGYVDAAKHQDLRTTAEIGLVGYPYYQHPRVVRPARLLFAFISVLGLLLLGLLARELGGLLAMVLAPAWLALSALYFEQSQSYLNVNIVGTCLVTGVALWVLRQLENPDFAAKVWVPGVLSGMVIACKYNFFPVVLTPLVAIFFFGGERRLKKAAALVGVMGLTFLVCAPYTLLDFRGFLDDLGRITYDYSKDNVFSTAESATFGGHLLLHLRELGREFGAISFLFVLAGGFLLGRGDVRRFAVVSAAPVAILLQASSLPTHFLRNLLPFFPFWALLGALGLAAAIAALDRFAARNPRLAAWPAWGRRAAAAGVLLLTISFLLPLKAPKYWLAVPLTSRQEATAWILAEVPKEQPLIVAEELGLHPGPLKKAGYQLTQIPVRALGPIAFRAELAKAPGALVLLPRMISDHWEPTVAAAGAQVLPKIEGFHQELEVVRSFGSSKVSVCFPSPTGGDPEFVVGRARRSQHELQGMAQGHLFPGQEFQGPMTQVQGLGLAILAQALISSPAVELPAGKYRAAIDATGSPVRERYPVVRVKFGDLELGKFVAGENADSATFDFELASPTRAALTLELLNDEIERDAEGKIVADRNVWLQGAFLYPHAP